MTTSGIGGKLLREEWKSSARRRNRAPVVAVGRWREEEKENRRRFTSQISFRTPQVAARAHQPTTFTHKSQMQSGEVVADRPTAAPIKYLQTRIAAVIAAIVVMIIIIVIQGPAWPDHDVHYYVD